MKQNATRIYNRALFYLQRFSATEKHLETVLLRQLENKRRKGDEVPDEAPQWVRETVTKCVNLGLVNDRAFAESRLNTLRRQGRSIHYIKQHMAQKGVPKQIILDLLQDNNPEDELQAAIRLVERRRLGRDTTPEGRQKDLAKIVRAGFAFDIAKKALGKKESSLSLGEREEQL